MYFLSRCESFSLLRVLLKTSSMTTMSVPSAEQAEMIKQVTANSLMLEPLARMALKKSISYAITELESEACLLIIRRIASKFAQKIVTELAVRAVVSGLSTNVLPAILAAMGPIGWVIDGLTFGFTIIAMIYDHYDPKNFKVTYFRATLENMLRDIEDKTKYDWYKFAKGANLDFDYPVELNGVDVFDSREWKVDLQKELQNSLTYADQLVSNLTTNARGEIIDLEALCETDEDIDRSLLTHPPSWNQAVQRSLEGVIPSQNRAKVIHEELDQKCTLLEGLVPMGWISLFSVGVTIAFRDLTMRQKSNFSHRATHEPTGFMKRRE